LHDARRLPDADADMRNLLLTLLHLGVDGRKAIATF
jgi:hypothetical protein